MEKIEVDEKEYSELVKFKEQALIGKFPIIYSKRLGEYEQFYISEVDMSDKLIERITEANTFSKERYELIKKVRKFEEENLFSFTKRKFLKWKEDFNYIYLK